MDNQPWDKARLEEWKKFWESEMGQESLKKMQAIKDQWMNEALGQSDPNVIAACVGRAAGVEIIMQDIKAGFDALERMGKEAEKKK